MNEDEVYSRCLDFTMYINLISLLKDVRSKNKLVNINLIVDLIPN